MAERISCAALVLAAGASSRMGRAKQLLPVDGRTLLRHVVDVVAGAPVSSVLVVLGSGANEIAPCLAGTSANVVVNERWSEGLGSSVSYGMQSLAKLAPECQAVIIALADQPGFSSAHLAALIATHLASGRPVVASHTDGTPRPPALFASSWFPLLRALTGDEGARNLLRDRPGEVAAVLLENACDLDTPADYEKFLGQLRAK